MLFPLSAYGQDGLWWGSSHRGGAKGSRETPAVLGGWRVTRIWQKPVQKSRQFFSSSQTSVKYLQKGPAVPKREHVKLEVEALGRTLGAAGSGLGRMRPQGDGPVAQKRSNGPKSPTGFFSLLRVIIFFSLLLRFAHLTLPSLGEAIFSTHLGICGCRCLYLLCFV